MQGLPRRPATLPNLLKSAKHPYYISGIFLINEFYCIKLVIENRKMAVCIAVIGKDNSPQFIACADPESELQFHYKVNTSLDIVEEKLSNVATAEIKKLYLGLLHSTEEHKIYGYATNTKIKFIIIVKTSNVTLRDNDIYTMFKKLHSSYVDIVSNPFYIPGDPLVSKNFQSIVRGIMAGNL